MAFNIQEFQGALQYGGARPSNFEVRILNPVNSTADIQVPFLCKAAQIPGSTLNNIDINYFGRPVKFTGNRTFEDWTVTIYNDEDFAIRNALEQWSNSINGFQSNIRTGTGSSLEYKSDAQVVHYGKNGNVIRIYRFIGLYPLTIAPIQLDWDSGQEIETFDVTFAYDYWEVDNNTTGNPGN